MKKNLSEGIEDLDISEVSKINPQTSDSEMIPLEIMKQPFEQLLVMANKQIENGTPTFNTLDIKRKAAEAISLYDQLPQLVDEVGQEEIHMRIAELRRELVDLSLDRQNELAQMMMDIDRGIRPMTSGPVTIIEEERPSIH